MPVLPLPWHALPCSAPCWALGVRAAGIYLAPLNDSMLRNPTASRTAPPLPVFPTCSKSALSTCIGSARRLLRESSQLGQVRGCAQHWMAALVGQLTTAMPAALLHRHELPWRFCLVTSLCNSECSLSRPAAGAGPGGAGCIGRRQPHAAVLLSQLQQSGALLRAAAQSNLAFKWFRWRRSQ